MQTRDENRRSQQTIDDFGEQWTRFTGNEGYYGSDALFEDICGPLLTREALRGLRVAEIGSGTGRIVRMLLSAGAEHIVALEPSAAYDVLKSNVAEYGDRVECVRATGEHLPSEAGFDLVVSIGVLHHIPNPHPVVEAAYRALKPGGRILVWLYGREGNAAYLALTLPLRSITTRLPHGAVLPVARFFAAVLQPYIWMSGRFALPLSGYFSRVFGRMSRDKQVLIIYDQLRPAHAKYYRRDEAIALITSAGFSDVQVYHRHGYSWTILARRV